MSKIIYIDQRQLGDPTITPVLEQFPQHNWKNIINSVEFNTGIDSQYCRTGSNTLPFKTDIVDQLNLRPPTYNPLFSLSFSEITDRRCQDLWKNKTTPWLVLWSGGIDSTVIVTSILKNISAADRKEITIACNYASIHENPKFFYTHIAPNFKIIDSASANFNQELLTQYTVLEGSPNDQLHAGGACQQLLLTAPEVLNYDFRKNPDRLITFLANRVNREFGIWYYENLKENIESVDVPVQTYHDFFWWNYFNYFWTTMRIRPWITFQPDSGKESFELFLNKVTMWFYTDEYQHWSMCNNHPGEKYGVHLGEYKLASKRYIYEFDRNEYYFKFKTKVESTSRTPNRQTHLNFFCMLDDFTTLTIARDKEQILELLPAHIV